MRQPPYDSQMLMSPISRMAPSTNLLHFSALEPAGRGAAPLGPWTAAT